MSLRIVTNNHERLLLDAYQLTEKELADFDWLPEGEGSFFCYRGVCYCLDEFMACPNDIFPGNWDGYASDSFFSGVLVRYSGDHVIVGTYFS